MAGVDIAGVDSGEGGGGTAGRASSDEKSVTLLTVDGHKSVTLDGTL